MARVSACLLLMLWGWSDGLVSCSLVADSWAVRLFVCWWGSLSLCYANPVSVLHDPGFGDRFSGDSLLDLRPVLADLSPASLRSGSALYVRGQAGLDLSRSSR